jgi:hypothetical protein
MAFKMAYAIQCHKNAEQVNKLVNQLSNKDIDFFIHVDKKSNITNKLTAGKNIYILEDRVNVRWSHISQVLGTLKLLEKIHSTKKYDYVHLISAQDFPIKHNEVILEYFKNNFGKQYIQFRKLPNDWPYKGMNRVLVYYPSFMFLNKYTRRLIGIYERLIMRYSILQRRIDKSKNFYGGSSWFSITGDCVEYILEFLRSNPDYLKFFNNTICGDEVFFQTILVDSKYRDFLVNDNKRYIDWSEGKSSPKILKIEDYTKLENSDKLFARKFDTNIDKEILKKLEKIIK